MFNTTDGRWLENPMFKERAMEKVRVRRIEDEEPRGWVGCGSISTGRCSMQGEARVRGTKGKRTGMKEQGKTGRSGEWQSKG